MNQIFVQIHLGLGDALICCGLIRELATRHDRVMVPAKYHNFDAVNFMFSDLENVMVIPLQNDQTASRLAAVYPSLRLGLFSAEGCDFKAWDEQFYRQAGMPYDYRWTKWKIPPVREHVPPPAEPYAFVHEDQQRKFLIDPSRVGFERQYRPQRTPTIFHHLSAIQSADEIHCIDSCFAILADSVFTKAKRHVLHLYASIAAKPAGPPKFKKEWEVIR